MAPREWVLGIDFGTSNTAAAHTGPVSGSVEALQLSHNRTTMSSAVFVESPDNIAVGDVAADRAEANPAGYVPAPKRAVGQGVVNVNGYDIPTSLPVAAVLESVLARATGAHGGMSPTELVLTHPEGWSQREVQVLLDAAVKIGLDTSRIKTVSEPRAAAHYYSRANTLTPGTKIAVFDFGGGTLDIAVLEANEHGTFDVVAARGDNGLGGKNLDAAVRRWVDHQLEARNPDLLTFLRTQAPMDVRYALDDSIRRAKELLSEAPSATITVTGPPGVSERFQITREEFEELISAALDKAVTLTRLTLADAQVTDASQLEALYLTGGSSRIPIVHDRLKDLGPIATLDDPKTVVAQGALAAAAPIVRGLGGVPQAAPARPAPVPPPAPAPAQPTTPMPAPAGFAHPGMGGPQPGWPAAATAGAGAPPASPPPTGWPQATNAPVPDRAGGKNKVGLIAAAVVAVLAVGVGVGVFALQGGDEPADPATVAADVDTAGADVDTAASGGASAASGSGGGSSAALPTTKEAVVAAMPPALRSELEDCKTSGETENGGLQVQCAIKKGSSLTSGITSGDYQSIILAADVKEAKKRVISIRQGYMNDTASDVNEIVEDTARTAAAHIDGPSYNDSFSIWYGNSSTGVMAMFSGAQGLDGAKAFLNRSGLIT